MRVPELVACEHGEHGASGRSRTSDGERQQGIATHQTEAREENERNTNHVNGDIHGVMVVCTVLDRARLLAGGSA